jgi:uroporphyrinogen III methyltransferase / synthase
MGESGKKGTVYLIGAGPGDRGLITVRGLERLRRAEVVIYDYLANPQLLSEAPAAEHIYVGKTAGRHHTPQDRINALLLEHAGQGKIVARLKGGDPFIFGRGGEEALCLSRAGIPFEIIPGVTAAFAAAAFAGIPLTHRDFTTSLTLATGHENPSKAQSGQDWNALSEAGTLVFYMGMTNLPLIVQELIAHGRSPLTPVALVRWASTPRQQTLTATLETVVEEAKRVAFSPPAIIIIGEVVSLRPELRWFDRRPLFGKNILVTRAADQAGEFSSLLEAQGAQTVECPTIEMAPPESWTSIDEAIGRLCALDWTIFTSANAVRFFFSRLALLGRDARAFGPCRVCAVGPKTAEALERYGIRADLIPSDYKAEGVVEAFQEIDIAGSTIFLPRADRARDIIPTQLSSMGADVFAPVLYRNITPRALPAGILEELAAGRIDIVTFTSSSTIENFAAIVGRDRLHDLLEGVIVASIGPITSRSCRNLGLRVDIEPEAYTLDALTDAIVAFCIVRK